MAYISKRTGEEVDALLNKVEKGDFTITIDTELSDNSDNAIANSTVTKALKSKVEQSEFTRTVRGISTSIALKPDKDGYYPEMSVGMADNLVGRGDVQDALINFRPSAGADNITDGAARVERIKGNSVVYNQLISNTRFETTNNYNMAGGASLNVDGGIATITLGTSNNSGVTNIELYGKFLVGHKYLFITEAKADAEMQNVLIPYVLSASVSPKNTVSTEWRSYSFVQEATSANMSYGVARAGTYGTDFQGGEKIYVKSFRVIDLTKEFSAEVANNITSYEGYLQLKPINIEDEFAYNEGELIDMKVDALISTSDNAYDSENDYARVMGGVPYTITIDNRKDITPEEVVFATNAEELADDVIYPNADGTYTFPNNGYANASFMGAEIGKEDTICICLKHSYEKPHPPYQQVVKDLSFISEAFPNGMRSAGSACDEIRFNPTSQRWEMVTRIGAVDLGSLTWQYKEAYQCFCSVENYFIPLGKGTTSTYILNNVAASALSDRQFSFHTSFGTGKILIKDLRYTDAQTFKNELQGVLLNYELAEPIVEPTPLSPSLNLDYPVWDFGTEEAMASVPSAPFRADINYEPNAVDDLRWAISEIRSLRAQIAQLQSTQVSETNLME